MGWKKLVVGLVVFFLTGCGYFTTNYYRNAEGGKRAKVPKFSLSKPNPYQLQNADIIDTNAIYVFETSIEYGETKTKTFAAFRFFENGRVMRVIADDRALLLTKVAAPPASASFTGYYRIADHVKIAIEYFGTQKNTDNYKTMTYRREEGTIRGDSLILFVDPEKNKPLPNPKIEGTDCRNCFIYIRQKVNSLSGQPDW